MIYLRENILDNDWAFYYPSFLMMRIKTTESLLDINSIAEETEALYLHEFTHYLQDLTTTYGLMNICLVVDFMKDISQIILSDDNPNFKVPFDVNSFDETTQTNWKLKKNYLGSWKNINTIEEPQVYKCSTPRVYQNRIIEHKKIILKFKDEFGQEKQYYFGAHCISENLSYLIEDYLYHDIIPKPSKLPYFSAKIIADLIYPNFSNNILNLIALCDACMMLFEPGVFFYETLLEMSKVNYIPNKPEDIYNFIDKVEFKFNGITTVPDLLNHFKNLAINQISDYFTTPLFGKTKQWLNYSISNYVNLRLNNPSFMLDFINNGRLKLNKDFQNFLYEYGSPLVLNDNHELSIILPSQFNDSVFPEYLWMIKQIYSIFTKGIHENTFKCDMIEWCENSCKLNGQNNFTDEKCRYAPWEHSQDFPLCKFGIIWKVWGFMDKKPTDS